MIKALTFPTNINMDHTEQTHTHTHTHTQTYLEAWSHSLFTLLELHFCNISVYSLYHKNLSNYDTYSKHYKKYYERRFYNGLNNSLYFSKPLFYGEMYFRINE